MMNMKMPVLAVACTLALAACGGGNNPPTSEPVTALPSTVSTPGTSPAYGTTSANANMGGQYGTPMATSGTAPAAASTAAGGKPTAVVNDCSTEIEADDAMQYNVSSIVVPSSCDDFKITLKHTGHLPVKAMGHDVVITKKSDMEAVDAAGAKAGLDNGYLKPDDSRVIAHTDLIGGGETTSVSFPVKKIQGDGPYVFFCSFPGHSVTMHGSISVQKK